MSKCIISSLSNQMLIVSSSIARKIIGLESSVKRRDIFLESNLAGGEASKSTNCQKKSVQVLL